MGRSRRNGPFGGGTLWYSDEERKRRKKRMAKMVTRSSHRPGSNPSPGPYPLKNARIATENRTCKRRPKHEKYDFGHGFAALELPELVPKPAQHQRAQYTDSGTYYVEV